MNCKICANKSTPIFKAKILNKYDVQYFKCSKCEFIQTEKPYWLEEAYTHAIADLDVGLVYRNLDYTDQIYTLITNNLNLKKKYLDYAGGYGLFVRIMRDRGLDYIHYDKYCENIFAKNHGIKDSAINSKFEGLTALEVFEHLEDPLNDIKEMLLLSDTIIFSTELIEKHDIQSAEDWWYFVPETGQHIAFYSPKTLKVIAKKLALSTFSKGNLHLFSKRTLKRNPFLIKNKNIKLDSLLNHDFLLAKELSKNNEIGKQSINNDKIEIALADIAPFIVKIDKINKQKNIVKRKLKRSVELVRELKTKYLQSSQELDKIKKSKGWNYLTKFYKLKFFIYKILVRK